MIQDSRGATSREDGRRGHELGGAGDHDGDIDKSLGIESQDYDLLWAETAGAVCISGVLAACLLRFRFSGL